jgi:hypothetical protein
LCTLNPREGEIVYMHNRRWIRRTHGGGDRDVPIDRPCRRTAQARSTDLAAATVAAQANAGGLTTAQAAGLQAEANSYLAQWTAGQRAGFDDEDVVVGDHGSW